MSGPLPTLSGCKPNHDADNDNDDNDYNNNEYDLSCCYNKDKADKDYHCLGCYLLCWGCRVNHDADSVDDDNDDFSNVDDNNNHDDNDYDNNDLGRCLLSQGCR